MDFFLTAESKAEAGFDVEELYSLTGGDPLVIRRLLEGLVEGINEDLATLAHVRACGANNGVMELAHRVKGAARLIKAHSLAEHCEQLQLAYRRSSAPSSLSLPLGRMEKSMVLLGIDLLGLSKLRE